MPRYLHAPHAELLPSRPHGGTARRRSDLHVLILALVWLTLATGAIVFTEPAPFDALMMGLIVLLPIAGLAVFTPGMLLMLAGWLIIAGAGLGAAVVSLDIAKSVTHTLVTLYLSVAAFILAGFIHKRPEPHMRLIMNAYMWSAVGAAVLGIIGYFDVPSGTHELFTSFGRARGTFKDPNVFGPYLVPPLVYATHLWFSRPTAKTLVPLAVIFILSLALFLSFSRGAWVNLAIAMAAFGYLSFILSRSNWARFKLLMVALACVGALGAVALVALQVESISKLAVERASLDQTYDQGPEGRFGGQLKAIGLILDHPFGIGAGEFTQRHHHEEVHNVYLAMSLNAGWIGGIVYLLLVIVTLAFGLRQLVRPTDVQGSLIVAWSCLLAIALEGFLIDSDHWRHFFLLMAMVWGLGEAARLPQIATVGRMPPRARRGLDTRPVIEIGAPSLAAIPRRNRTARTIVMAASVGPRGDQRWIPLRAVPPRAVRAPRFLRHGAHGSLRLN